MILISDPCHLTSPVSVESKVKYRIEQPGMVSIALFDYTGIQVKQLDRSWKEAGEHEVTVNMRPLGIGTYFIKLETENRVSTEKIIKLE